MSVKPFLAPPWPALAGLFLILTVTCAAAPAADAAGWQTIAPHGYRLLMPGTRAPVATGYTVTFDSAGDRALLAGYFDHPLYSINQQNGGSYLTVGGVFDPAGATLGQVQVHRLYRPCKPTGTYGMYTLTFAGDGEAYTACTWVAIQTDGWPTSASIYLDSESFPDGSFWSISRANLIGHETLRTIGLTHINDVPNDCPHQDDAGETPAMCEPLGGYQGDWAGYATPDDALGICVLAQYAGRRCAGWPPYFTDASARTLTGVPAPPARRR